MKETMKSLKALKGYYKKKEKDIDFKMLESVYHDFDDANQMVDDITWHDLEMDQVYTALNYTTTTPGEHKLYEWLRNPTTNEKDFNHRAKFLKYFEEAAIGGIDKIRNDLIKLKYTKFNYKQVLLEDFYVNYLMLIGCSLSAISVAGIIIASILTKTLVAFPILLLLLAINFYIHYSFGNKYGPQVAVVKYTIGMIHFVRNNEKILKKIMPEEMAEMDVHIKHLKGLRKRGKALFFVEGADVISDYLNIGLLFKEVNFLILSKDVNKYKEDIKALIEFVGNVDCGIAIREYKFGLKYSSKPVLTTKSPSMVIDSVYHPLLENPIPNDVDFPRSVAITGSNMSGKSTFLRTVGLNALISQGLCVSLSKAYESTFFRIVSSISLNDDLEHGKSYFLMEAEAINRMIGHVDEEIPTLILIDEIFKGTNPVERLSAAIEILNVLEAGNTLTIVATHDLQILNELKDYDFYYFTEEVNEEGMTFNYEIQKGIASTRNAIKILELLKYPKSITDQINDRIAGLEEV